MRSLLRIAYRAILRMHPASFRAEFADEMLWIFDEESRRGRVTHLLFDGVRSIAIQHAKPRIQQAETAGPYYCEIDSSTPAVRFGQAGFIILSCIFCIFNVSLFLSMVAPKLTVFDASKQKDWLFTRIKILSPIPAPSPQNPATNLWVGDDR